MRDRPTRDIVLDKVQRIFPNDDPAEIVAILDRYGAESYQRERERVQLACLKLSEGNKDQLVSVVKLARSDYRDVLAPAEYPGYDKIGFVGVNKLDTEGKRKLIYEDLRQYLSCLQDTDEPDIRQYQEELKDTD